MIKIKSGFTLIELMVAVTVLLLMIGVGAVALNNFNSRQKVSAAKDEMISNIKLTRNYATTMQTPDGTTGKLSYVELQITPSGQMTAIAHDIDQQYFQSLPFPDVNVTLSDNIQFGAYKGNSLAGDVTITIKSSENPSVQSVIKILSSGLIYEE
jgi:prepilin-type N-terminal cleavage/methylation domain-containing protein